MGASKQAALLVEPDQAEAGRLRPAVTATGCEVIRCRGPGAELCPVEHGRPCALAREADVIVVDLSLQTEASLEEGISPGELLAYYLGEGKPVIVLTRSPQGIRPFLDERVQVLGRPPDVADLSAAIRSALRPDESRVSPSVPA